MKCPTSMDSVEWQGILHIGTILAGAIGLLAIVASWLAGEGGMYWGFSYIHWVNDAQMLLMTAIWFALGKLIHKK